MIIEIDLAVVTDPSAQPWLRRILYRVEDGWHLWRVTRADQYEQTDWIKQNHGIRELLRATVRRAAWDSEGDPHGRTLRVTSTPKTVDDLPPEEACRLADATYPSRCSTNEKTKASTIETASPPMSN